jgi:hypothetical protein
MSEARPSKPQQVAQGVLELEQGDAMRVRTGTGGADGLRRSGVVLALAWLSACGGGGGSPTSSNVVATPQPCTQSTVFQGQGSFGASTLDAETFTTTTTGRLDVTVDWTFATSDIGVYVVPANSCGLAAFNARTCNFLIRSESGAKPRKVSLANLSPGTYDLLLGNFASQTESMSALVVVSSSTCPAITGASFSETAQPLARGHVKGLR